GTSERTCAPSAPLVFARALRRRAAYARVAVQRLEPATRKPDQAAHHQRPPGGRAVHARLRGGVLRRGLPTQLLQRLRAAAPLWSVHANRARFSRGCGQRADPRRTARLAGDRGHLLAVAYRTRHLV